MGFMTWSCGGIQCHSSGLCPDLNPCLGLKLPNRPDCQFSLQVGPSGNPLPGFEFRSVILKVHFASGTHVSGAGSGHLAQTCISIISCLCG